MTADLGGGVGGITVQDEVRDLGLEVQAEFALKEINRKGETVTPQ